MVGEGAVWLLDDETSLIRIDGSTRVNLTAEVEATGFFKLAAPILTRIIQRQVENDVGTLKDLLEAQT